MSKNSPYLDQKLTDEKTMLSYKKAYRWRGFTCGWQESGSVFSATMCQIQASTRCVSPYHSC